MSTDSDRNKLVFWRGLTRLQISESTEQKPNAYCIVNGAFPADINVKKYIVLINIDLK